MAEPQKIVKGGFRATLALIISVLALIVAIMAYTSAGKEEELKTRLKDLQATLENVKKESGAQFEKLRNETAKSLESLSATIKEKKESQKETQ